MYDLHSHTFYSDGRYSPSEIVQAAVRKGLKGIAITDHDNAKGSREAAPLAQKAGIELIPAIEMTTCWPGAALPLSETNVDVLGYFVDLENPLFKAYEQALLNDLHDRIRFCCEELTQQGYPVTMEDVFAENRHYAGALHLAMALHHKGYAKDWRSANHLMYSVWNHVRDTPFTIRSAIEQIHLAGGVAVLAHPSIVRPGSLRMTEPWLKWLVEMGLDGIEIYHYRLNAEARQHFLGLAKALDLLITGGSDAHGWRNGLDEIGEEVSSEEMVAAIRARRGRTRL